VRYRRLGNSGLLVSELALGTMLFGEASDRGVAADEAERIIARFVDIGGSHLDLADIYAGGRAEEIVGRAIRGRRGEVVLTTKGRFATGPGPNDQGLSRYHLVQGVEASLRRLGTDAIDVFYVHAWDPLTPLEETLRALDDLVSAGKIRYLGASNLRAWQLMRMLGVSDLHGWIRPVAAQYQYSLVVRDIEPEIADACAYEGIGIVAWAPLASGFLTGRYRPDSRPTSAADGRLATAKPDWEEAWDRRATARNWAILSTVKSIAQRLGVTPSQVAIAWLLARPEVASVVVGVRSVEQLAENEQALGVRLTAEDLDQLNVVSAPPEGYPYRMLRVADCERGLSAGGP
jgi:aryl-alcohol dehydrogenase-like predicted oxidoreductase